MKKKDLIELRKKDVTDLVKQVSEKKLELSSILAKMRVSEESNVKKASNLRDEIAKILTIIREKQLIAENSVK